jgi:beta-lactamase regulating signal transducer with metallopeptidase domain
MNSAALQSLMHVLTEQQLNTVAAGVLLTALVWMLLRFVGRQNSGTRFVIWFSSLLAIVALPFFSASVFHSSHLRVPSAHLHGEIILAASWASYLFAAWAVCATVLLLRLGIGLWRVRTIRRNCTELDLEALAPAIAGIFQTLSSRREVRLCTSRELAVPAAVGLFRPAIVLPELLLSQLSVAEVEMIVRHELAHLHRWDDWTNLAQKIVKALFFFHPAVWWIENRLTLEREMACDDIVLAQTGSPRTYASSLISFAEKLHSARGLALAQALVSRTHQMSLRVAQILDTKRPNNTRLWKPVLGLSTGLLTLVFAAAPYMPRFVAFEKQSSSDHAHTTQATQQAASVGQQSHVSNAIVNSAVVRQVAERQSFASQPKAIPATFHPRTAVTQQLKAKTAPAPMIMRTSTMQKEPSIETIYILRTVEYDVFDPYSRPVWTLCIWKVDRTNPAEEQLESAIVVSWI